MHELTFSDGKYLVRHVVKHYAVERGRVQVMGVRISKTKELLLFELLVPSIMHDAKIAHLEFVASRLRDPRVHHVKVSIDIDTSAVGKGPFPFDFTDNIQPWNVPYVCVQLGDTFGIHSLLTGQQVFSVCLQRQLARDVKNGFVVSGVLYWHDNLLVWSKVLRWRKMTHK